MQNKEIKKAIKLHTTHEYIELPFGLSATLHAKTCQSIQQRGVSLPGCIVEISQWYVFLLVDGESFNDIVPAPRRPAVMICKHIELVRGLV